MASWDHEDLKSTYEKLGYTVVNDIADTWKPTPNQTYEQLYDHKFNGSSDKAHIKALGEKSDGSSTEYYKIPTNSTDLIDLIEFKNMNFAVGNIFKACYRLGQKDGNDDAYDLRKIIFFAQRELDRVTR